MESRADQIERETRWLRGFQSKADDISRLILNTDLPWVDIAIQIEQLRREAERLFPRKSDLFEMVYVSRFKRLWQQWRQRGGRGQKSEVRGQKTEVRGLPRFTGSEVSAKRP
jgi:hypothetical protein